MFAVANTVLLNYVMGSRLLYGMARQGLVPRPLGKVHATRRTPHVAILTLLAVVVVLVLSGSVTDLATSTGLLLLVCFMIVNGALIVLKLRPGEPKGRFEVPLFVPALGILVNGALVVTRVMDRSVARKGPLIAGGICAAISLLYLIMRPKHIDEQSLAAAEHETEI
jgi:basic amino acid/polyamine antiporter, APA family